MATEGETEQKLYIGELPMENNIFFLMLGLLFVGKNRRTRPKKPKTKKKEKKKNNKRLDKINMDAKCYQAETVITNIDGLLQRVKKYQ